MSGLKAVDTPVVWSVTRIDEGVEMSIVRTITQKSSTRARRGGRDLARALAKAPTRSSREELLLLQNMGR